MASVTPDRVRDRVKLSATDIDDSKVTELIKDSEATIEAETGLTIDYADCTQSEATAITNLAAIYCLVYISGGVASGLSYKIGSLNVAESSSWKANKVRRARSIKGMMALAAVGFEKYDQVKDIHLYKRPKTTKK